MTVAAFKRPENWVNKFELDLNGGMDPVTDSEAAKWAEVSQGIMSVTPASNETDDTQSFWPDKGFSETDATGKRATFAFTGQRVVGDPAQDYIAARFLAIGDALRTLARWTDQNGNALTCNVTLTAIVPFGGNANARQTFSFTLSYNGKPELTTGAVSNDDGTGVNGVISGDANVGLGDNTVPKA
ncbi:phage tail tube protein [Loigolactobacillus backii]|uniref:phage tail tube protein n=1 Tax=Loigolactobacillus backii TaxID=375175 RepID=UPI001EE6EF51|nr:capsid protein [Loigolactobacillus backii]